MKRVLAIGECMIELTHRDADTLSLGCAGDTFNTATYLARITAADEVGIDYLTSIGDEHYSERVLAAIAAEGVGTDLIGRVPDAQPGLYLVRNDDNGERNFTYYRSRSAARGLFDQAAPEADDYDLVYLSAITLQILTPRARQRMWDFLRRVRRRGGAVAFDSNYRPSGWSGADEARENVRAAWELTTIGLPTFSDEAALFGDESPTVTAARLGEWGVSEVAVKDGESGCVAWTRGAEPGQVASERVDVVVDSTAAGDAFNAGYLAARLAGAAQTSAVRRAHVLAAEVIRHSGAIVAESVLPRRKRTA